MTAAEVVAMVARGRGMHDPLVILFARVAEMNIYSDTELEDMARGLMKLPYNDEEE
jgi:hypothetical protein